jgi:hypothetical protein
LAFAQALQRESLPPDRVRFLLKSPTGLSDLHPGHHLVPNRARQGAHRPWRVAPPQTGQTGCVFFAVREHSAQEACSPPFAVRLRQNSLSSFERLHVLQVFILQ